MRVVSGCIAAVFTGLLFGLIMGEYELLGAMAIVAGVLFGLAVAEVSITVGKTSDWPLVIAAAASSLLGMAWAAYIDAGDDLGRVAGLRWVGALLAGASAGWWVRTLGSREVRSPLEPESP